MGQTICPSTHTRTREEAISGWFGWEIISYPHPHARGGDLVNLDRCPKLLKIAALFEEAINAAGNVIGNVTVNVSCV